LSTLLDAPRNAFIWRLEPSLRILLRLKLQASDAE
jgi:hypothetical protein